MCYYCVDPADKTQLIKLDNTNITEPLFKVNEPVTLKPHDLMNVLELTNTTYGVINNNGGIYNLYDGIISGTTDAINGTINELEDG